MPFTRPTILRAANIITDRHDTHARFNHLMMQFDVESYISGNSLQHKANALATFAISNPNHQTSDGRNLLTAIVEEAVGHYRSSEDQDFVTSLGRDGYQIVQSEGRPTLRAMLPAIADLPSADDEVHTLLDDLGMTTAKGHLDQAIRNHTRREWASANSQIRTFMEELFNATARRLDPGLSPSLTSENLRQSLAAITPPFLDPALGEWGGDGKNFVNGLFKRLHSAGSHPGLSEEEDCTFRLHLALIVARHYLIDARFYASCLMEHKAHIESRLPYAGDSLFADYVCVTYSLSGHLQYLS